MPVWGPILGNMNRTNLQDKQLRISNLSRYLESIQAQVTAGGQIAPGRGDEPEGAHDQGKEAET